MPKTVDLPQIFLSSFSSSILPFTTRRSMPSSPKRWVPVRMATAIVPVYFEQSWAILSTIGVINVFFGVTVVGITSLSPISLVPLVTSVAAAIANGLCYYAFYGNYNTTATVIAASFADIFWLVWFPLLLQKHSADTKLIGPRSRIVVL